MENNKIKIEANEISPDTKKSLSSRILVGFILAIIFIPTIIVGDYLFFAVFFIVSLIAIHELLRAPQNLNTRFKRLIYIVSYIVMILLIYWIFIRNNVKEYYNLKQLGLEDTYKFSLTNSFSKVEVSLNTYCICVAFLFLLSILDSNFKIFDAFYFIVMIFVVSLGFQSIYFLRYYPFTDFATTVDVTTSSFRFLQSCGLIVFVLLGTCMNDIGAYFVGILFGKHKMCEHISPKKTWEGFVGGVVTSIIFTSIFGFVCASLSFPITSFLTLDRWYNILIFSIMIPFVGTLGDLVFSAIKRHYGIKDYGTILKEHGGILDRIDSLLFTFIASALLTMFINNIGL